MHESHGGKRRAHLHADVVDDAVGVISQRRDEELATLRWEQHRGRSQWRQEVERVMWRCVEEEEEMQIGGGASRKRGTPTWPSLLPPTSCAGRSTKAQRQSLGCCAGGRAFGDERVKIRAGRGPARRKQGLWRARAQPECSAASSPVAVYLLEVAELGDAGVDRRRRRGGRHGAVRHARARVRRLWRPTTRKP